MKLITWVVMRVLIVVRPRMRVTYEMEMTQKIKHFFLLGQKGCDTCDIIKVLQSYISFFDVPNKVFRLGNLWVWKIKLYNIGEHS